MRISPQYSFHYRSYPLLLAGCISVPHTFTRFAATTCLASLATNDEPTSYTRIVATYLMTSFGFVIKRCCVSYFARFPFFIHRLVFSTRPATSSSRVKNHFNTRHLRTTVRVNSAQLSGATLTYLMVKSKCPAACLNCRPHHSTNNYIWHLQC